ncbi:NAD(P)-binding protein [Obba rivulosa]|uniref:NAD(P)-binding protein n=1 Tax=Obba rivulosa TaxID=1052685 RepID=A0A8E2B1F1_9APHY|nr:NAD(P)-binding protein [Obba rivulosa]
MSSASVPPTMRAWRVVRKGEPSKALQFDENVPVPSKLSPGDVLVKVQAAALNPVGYKLMKLLPNFIAKRPHIAEYDLAGVVVDGNGTKWKAGDAVYGMITSQQTMKTRQGALAEYTGLPASNLLARPSSVPPTQAAGLTLAGLTAYQCLFRVGGLEPGQSVFVNGGSTAVGAFAIQLAKAVGCTVAASASGKNEQFVKSLGADEFFDYTKEPLHKQLEARAPSPKYHLIVEAVGLIDLSIYTHSEAYLAPGGAFVSVGPQPNGFDVPAISKLLWDAFLKPTWLGGTKRAFKIIRVTLVEEDMQAFGKYVEEGKVKAPVDSVYEFRDVLKAYERMMTGRATGKIIVKVDPEAE